jgi:hypothetical protein
VHPSRRIFAVLACACVIASAGRICYAEAGQRQLSPEEVERQCRQLHSMYRQECLDAGGYEGWRQRPSLPSHQNERLSPARQRYNGPYQPPAPPAPGRVINQTYTPSADGAIRQGYNGAYQPPAPQATGRPINQTYTPSAASQRVVARLSNMSRAATELRRILPSGQGLVQDLAKSALLRGVRDQVELLLPRVAARMRLLWKVDPITGLLILLAEPLPAH